MSDDEYYREQHERRMAEERAHLDEASRRSMFNPLSRDEPNSAQDTFRRSSAWSDGAAGRLPPTDIRFSADYDDGRRSATGQAEPSAHSNQQTLHHRRVDIDFPPSRYPESVKLSDAIRDRCFADGYYGVCLQLDCLGQLEVDMVKVGRAAFIRSLKYGAIQANAETYESLHNRRTYHPIAAMMAGFAGHPRPNPARTSAGAMWCFNRGAEFGTAYRAFERDLADYQAELRRREALGFLRRQYAELTQRLTPPNQSSEVQHALYLLHQRDLHLNR